MVDADQAAIDAYLKANGVTQCPPAYGTVCRQGQQLEPVPTYEAQKNSPARVQAAIRQCLNRSKGHKLTSRAIGLSIGVAPQWVGRILYQMRQSGEVNAEPVPNDCRISRYWLAHQAHQNLNG